MPATVTITNVPPPSTSRSCARPPDASASTGSGTATILISADGSLASVSVSYSNLSSDEVVAHLAIGGDMNNGTYVLNLPERAGLGPGLDAHGGRRLLGGPGGLGPPVRQPLRRDRQRHLPERRARRPVHHGARLAGVHAARRAPGHQPEHGLGADAPRFLTQATFGPTTTDIATLQSEGYAAWIANQMAVPETSHRAATDADANAFPPTGPSSVTQNNRQAAWWKIVVTAPDQLRQRVAFALSEIFVTSDVASQLANEPDGLANYYDLLANDAFGNFRQLLQDVTLSPAMGNYLNMLRTPPPTRPRARAADENYAREVQQLFTIGLNELQPDGTLMLDSTGLPIPTYNQNEIVQTANVFTGLGLHSTATNPSFYGAAANFDHPMMLYPAYHDNTQKTIVNNIVLPANQGGAADLKAELDALFNHQNTGPFICSQLIQRLVTSNPSPGTSTGWPRSSPTTGPGPAATWRPSSRPSCSTTRPGRLPRRPTGLREAEGAPPADDRLYRAFGAAASDGRFAIFNAQTNLDEAALRSPTVFNFFDPGYVQQGALASPGSLPRSSRSRPRAPPISVPNNIYSAIYTPHPAASTTIALDLSSLTANATNPAAMVATLNQLLCANMMSAQTQQSIESAIMARPAGTTSTPSPRMALYLAATSPDAAIQR
jgi:hypothetical protein